MNRLIKLLAVGTSACLLYSVPASAQEDGYDGIDEIVITGRKREETLQDVPVSASVLSANMISDAGIDELNDLFSLIPGLHYDEDGDRLGALPSVRGVQSQEISSNRTLVTAFVDGMPVLGSQGSIGFNSFQQVEVYRGPQSASFGRSTFAGAINYITKDPTEDFEAEIEFDGSDFGERVLSGAISGPITENLGFILQFEHEDSEAPDNYIASGDLSGIHTGLNLYQVDDPLTPDVDESLLESDIPAGPLNVGASDGTLYNSQTGDNISIKFAFEPTDKLSFDLVLGHVETHDQQNASFFLTEEAKNACFTNAGLDFNGTPAGMEGIYKYGVLDCDWDSVRPNFAQHNHEQYLLDNPLLFDSIYNAALAAGADEFTFEDGSTMSVEDQIYLVARGYSVPEDHIGTRSERDRITLQTDYLFDNGSAVQLSLMRTEETQNRMSANTILYYDPDNVGVFDDEETSNMAPGVGITWGDLAMDGTENWEWQNGMGGPMTIAASPTEIEETYAEIRWVSPGEDRLRWVVGGSFYEYDYLEENYANSDMGAYGLGYGARLFGIEDQFVELVGIEFEPDESILSERAVNTAAYFNLQYDISEKLTFSLEGRYQEDEVGGINTETGLSAIENTTSFLPRVAFNYSVNEDLSLYVQYAKGVNPAGINVDLLNDSTIISLSNPRTNALIPYDATYDVDIVDTEDPASIAGDNLLDAYDFDTGEFTDPDLLATAESYQSPFGADSFLSYKESEINNYEFGFKGNLFEGRLQYAGAIYSIDWKDQLQSAGINWDSPCADGQFAGVYRPDGETPTCFYEGVEYFFVEDDNVRDANNVGINFGDVEINGLELEGTFSITDNWQVRGSASYMEAKYADFCDIELALDDLQATEGYAELLGINVVTPTSDSTITSDCYDTSGNTVAEQPSVSWSLSPSYTRDVLNGLRLQARAQVTYEGQQYLTSLNFSKFPATYIGNLSLSLSGDHWGVTAYVENITDDTNPTRITSGGDNTDSIPGFGLSETITDVQPILIDVLGNPVYTSRSNFTVTPRRPRTYGLRASYEF